MLNCHAWLGHWTVRGGDIFTIAGSANGQRCSMAGQSHLVLVKMRILTQSLVEEPMLRL